MHVFCMRGNTRKTEKWNLAVLIKITILKSYSCLNVKNEEKC